MMTMELRTLAPDVTVLQVHGRITLGRCAQELEWKVEELLKSQVRRVVLDLAGVNFLDSTGIGIIMVSAARLRDAGGSLRLSGPTGVVLQTLGMCHISDVVPTFATAEEAASSFSAASNSA